MINLTIVEHPLVSHYLTILRNKNTSKQEFKNSIDKLSFLLAGQLYSSLKTDNISINTPLKKAKGKKIKEKVVLLPILRAGLGLIQGFIELLPEATVSHIGLYRDEESLRPIKYYFKFPVLKSKENVKVIILDPMVATGGSSIFTIEYVMNMGIKDINLVTLLCAPEGLNAIDKRFNNNQKKSLKIVTCSVDEKLNEHGYILPGLGDAGDRLFGTI